MPTRQRENIAMAFSNDSRKRIIDAYKKEGLSKAEKIRWFQISRTGLDDLINHVKETKSIKPKPHGGGRPSKCNSFLKNPVWTYNYRDFKKKEALAMTSGSDLRCPWEVLIQRPQTSVVLFFDWATIRKKKAASNRISCLTTRKRSRKLYKIH